MSMVQGINLDAAALASLIAHIPEINAHVTKLGGSTSAKPKADPKADKDKAAAKDGDGATEGKAGKGEAAEATEGAGASGAGNGTGGDVFVDLGGGKQAAVSTFKGVLQVSMMGLCVKVVWDAACRMIVPSWWCIILQLCTCHGCWPHRARAPELLPRRASGCTPLRCVVHAVMCKPTHAVRPPGALLGGLGQWTVPAAGHVRCLCCMMCDCHWLLTCDHRWG